MEEEIHLLTPQDDVFETIFPRVSCDKSVVNQTGRWLIEKCVDNQLYILNGRTLGDLMGQFTCHTPRGIHSMNVHDLSIFSDHCMISVKLKLFSEHCYDNEVNLRAHSSMSFAPDRFVWSERSKVDNQEAFSSQVMQDKMNNVKKDVSSDKIDVDVLISKKKWIRKNI